MSISPKTESRTFAFQFLYHVISQDLTINKENLESSLDEFIDSIGTPDIEVGTKLQPRKCFLGKRNDFRIFSSKRRR